MFCFRITSIASWKWGFWGVKSIVLKRWPATVMTVIALISFSAAAHADGMDADLLKKLMGTSSGNVSVRPIKRDDALRLTSNKDEMIRLDKDAASVIVNNPAHASIVLDSPRLLIIMP